MDSYKEKYQMNFEDTVKKVSPMNFNEILNLYRNSSYSNYISESLQTSNLKWVYPTISLTLIMELLTSQNYLINMFSEVGWTKYIFITLVFIYLFIGYFFLKANNEDSKQKINKNTLVVSSLSVFITLQLFFYYAGIMSNQSFFYYISVVIAIAVFPTLPTKNVVVLMFFNYMIFILISLIRHNYTSFFSICLNSFYVCVIGILLSFYFFTTKISALVNSKKVSVFAKEMASANDKLNFLNDELEKLSFTDSLTKINNRRAYEIYSEKIWSQGLRSGSNITILLVDIDHFKRFNDYFGHAQGDECLYLVAQAINSCFKRKSDLVARIGGEEFIIVLSSVGYDQVINLATRILEAVRVLKIEHPNSSVSKYVTASIGIVSLIPSKDMSLQMAFSFADKALYEAKSTGRDKYCIDNELYKKNSQSINRQLQIPFNNENGGSFGILTSICFFNIDYESKKAEFSKELCNLLGVESEDMNWIEDLEKYIYYKDNSTFKIFLEYLFSTSFKEVNIEFRLIEKTKKIMWVNCLCYLTYDETNKPLIIVGSLRNIDEEAKNKEIINDLLDGNYVYDLKSDTGILKGYVLNDLEISMKNAIFDFDNWYKSIYEKDKSIFDSFLRKAKDHDNRVQVINLSYRVRLKNKRLVWFSTRNKIYRDVDGIPSIINGTIINMERNLKAYRDKTISINSVSKLPDRKQFYKDFTEVLNSEEVYGSIVFIDIDNFTNINKIFGYSVGNEFLIKFSRLLKKNLIFDGDIYHFEGDIFAVIFGSLTKEKVLKQMKIIRDISRKPLLLNNVNYEYSLSISSIEYPKFGKNVDEILRNNDVAIQKIKANGKNNIIQFSDHLHLKNHFEMELEKELRKSIDNDMKNFELYFQPLVSSKTNECIGAEALLRWRKENGEMITPNIFIPILEKTGLMIKIGQWVYREAAKQCRVWLDRSNIKNKNRLSVHENFSMNINISALQLTEDNFESQFIDYLNSIKLNGRHVTIELTEQILIQDIEKTTKILTALRDKNIKVAIDDFGTGYSSLSYIRQLPIDEVKIDRSFIKDIESDAFSQQFVYSIINIAKTINKVICVEGVEKQEQYEILRDYGTDFLQGFLYSKPIPSKEFEELFLSSF